MSTTPPLTPISGIIDSTGIRAANLATILAWLQGKYQSLYGSDIVITPDSQDGGIIAAWSQAYSDMNQWGIAVYESFSPATAQGAGLASVVKVNGIQVDPATNSTCVVTIIGQNGVQLLNCIIQDVNGNLWNLPDEVDIPPSGTVNATATCQAPGAIAAGPNTVNKIYTQVLGWQSVTNSLDATPGAPIEGDGDLRERQSQSTSISAETTLDALRGAIGNVAGVQRLSVIDNDTNLTDSNGLQPHSIAAVVAGGDGQTIADTIRLKKDTGAYTMGTAQFLTVDQSGLPEFIRYYPLALTQIFVAIGVQPLAGYVASTGTASVQAVVNFLNALEIGQDVYQPWLVTAAQLSGTPLEQTFAVTSLTLGFSFGSLGPGPLTILFNAAAACSVGNVTLVTP